MAEIHFGIRVSNALYKQAKEKARPYGGLSKVIRSMLVVFTQGIRNFEPENISSQVDSEELESRFNIRLEQELYEQAKIKSLVYGGLSSVIRAMLKAFIRGKYTPQLQQDLELA